MARVSRRALVTVFAALVLAGAPPARGAEGMWLPNKLPTSRLAEHDFKPTAAWLEHVQKSAVRFSTGGSGSLVSDNGLVMTNHHVGSDLLNKLSTAERNLLQTGFHARSAAEELPCPDLELNILWEIEDVTDRVNGAVKEGMAPAEANAARRGAMAEIESQSQESTGLQSQVVTLYQGGQYNLYRYKRYTDVRLVFAPEEAIAFFGGDTDNFEYPRYCLDVCFFRIYEDGEPLKPEHHLAWSPSGSSAGDLVFVAGHPGRTRRLYTVEHLKFLRDRQMPVQLQNLWRAEVKSATFAQRSAEHARVVRDDLFGIQNSRKAVTGQYAGLTDPAIMGAKVEQQNALRRAVQANEEWERTWGDAWERIGASQEEFARFNVPFGLIEGGGLAQGSTLFGIARHVARLAAELPKPAGERLREYRDSNLPSLYLDLYSPAPIYEDLEIAKLAGGLSLLVERLGGDDPVVVAALAGKSPQARAAEVVRGTRLKDVDARRELVEGGAGAIGGSTDPMIQLALAIDPAARTLRKRFEDRVQAVEREAYAKIASAKFAVEGDQVYPDATFTLRLSFGTVRGYHELGREVAPYTNIAGLYERHRERKGQEGFELPERWVERKDKLDLSTPFNFVCDADIIGGNSGSPVVNRAGEVVGIIFDGNIHSLVSDFVYNDRMGRAVSVDSRGIIEALRTVYDAGALADEITAR